MNKTPFESAPKRFKIWDLQTNIFCESMKNEEGVFTLTELLEFALLHNAFGTNISDRFVFLQSTGFFDRNNKEIFEGSIVSLGFGMGIIKDAQFKSMETVPCNMPLSVIVYNPNAASFQYEWKGKLCRLKKITATNSFIVVGHILQNPELLEKRHE